MSRRKKQREETPIPPTSAGLLRFYEEKTESLIKLRPEIVIAITAALIIGVIIANIFL